MLKLNKGMIELDFLKISLFLFAYSRITNLPIESHEDEKTNYPSSTLV